MSAFINSAEQNGLSVKLWRGERTALIGMDVEDPEDDFVGFSIEVQAPGEKNFTPLFNRLNFSYPKPVKDAVTGFRNFPSTEAPFQKFRWLHFPPDPQDGKYLYRVTKKHMLTDDKVKSGESVALDISLEKVTYDGFLDIGFTRNFASSQAYAEKYKNNPNIIPGGGDDPLAFQKVAGDVYEWLGFEAYELIFGFLDEVVHDKTLTLDFFGYDLNEAEIVDKLKQIGPRLRAIIDDSKEHKDPSTPESRAAGQLIASAGAGNVKRTHFRGLQHNKVLIAKKNGKPYKVLCGSTNFSYRGLYIQANNAFVFYAPEAAQLFAEYYEEAFNSPKTFPKSALSKKWHLVNVASAPLTHICLSPHDDTELSLNPVGSAIDRATSSVFFDIAFLSQTKKGATAEAIKRLMGKDVFSYGISNTVGSLEVKKPDGSKGLVDFKYLAKLAPYPFSTEWSGMAKSQAAIGSKRVTPGINQHNKFVVTDFNLPSATLFTGSSNLSASGENKNGDHLVMIQDQKVATAYAIEAIRIFDHLHFRSRMQEELKGKTNKQATKALTLRKPTAISGNPAWFESSYQAGSQAEKDRLLFSR